MLDEIEQIELGNALVTAERRNRSSEAAAANWIRSPSALPIELDLATPTHALKTTLFNLARRTGLTTYDAAYLEIALRCQLPLASHDEQLNTAALSLGVALYQAQATLVGNDLGRRPGKPRRGNPSSGSCSSSTSSLCSSSMRRSLQSTRRRVVAPRPTRSLRDLSSLARLHGSKTASTGISRPSRTRERTASPLPSRATRSGPPAVSSSTSTDSAEGLMIQHSGTPIRQ